MTEPARTSTDTLPPAVADETPVGERQPALPASPARWFWPLVLAIVAGVALLAAWTLAEVRSADELVDTPRVSADHDPWIQARLGYREHAESSYVDPWAEARLGYRPTERIAWPVAGSRVATDGRRSGT
jgi:hypothetical protein